MNPTPDTVFAVHRRLLEALRRVMDLVGPGPVEPHFEDATAVARLVPARGRWADLGSGAGFPGIALAAFHPEARVELVESREKRASFLELVVGEAGLANAIVLRVRAESLEEGVYDGVISRAFAPPPLYLGLARRLARPGAQAVLLLAREEPPQVAGLELVERVLYRVGDRERTLCRYLRG